MIVDYHMHLRDSAGGIDHTADAAERFVEVALERGVDEIGFTEHVYYFEQTREVWELPYQLDRCHFDLDVYCDAVVAAKRSARGDRSVAVTCSACVDRCSACTPQPVPRSSARPTGVRMTESASVVDALPMPST